MNTKRFLLTAIYVAITFTFFACSTDNSIGGNNQSRLYCDYGPITQYGGGCFEIANASECDTQWGQVVSGCSNNNGNNGNNSNPSSSSTDGSRIEQCAGYCKWPDGCFIISTDPTGQYGAVTSSCTQAISNCQTNGQFFSNSTCSGNNNNNPSASAPNALEITLTKYKELASLDPIGYGDPRISFRVRAYRQGTNLNDNTTALLLNKDDINEWTGSVNATVTISDLADSVLVNPIVKDADVGFDDDVSPPGYYVKNFTNGTTFNNIESKNSYVSVTYSLRFYRR